MRVFRGFLVALLLLALGSPVSADETCEDGLMTAAALKAELTSMRDQGEVKGFQAMLMELMVVQMQTLVQDKSVTELSTLKEHVADVTRAALCHGKGMYLGEGKCQCDEAGLGDTCKAEKAMSQYASCKEILDDKPDAKSGWYSLSPMEGEGSSETFCDMNFEGGGWTLVGQGMATNNGDWLTSGSLNLGKVRSSTATWKLSDDWINAIPKEVIRMEGIGLIQANYYWAGTCVYRHTSPADDECNCRHESVTLGDSCFQGNGHTAHWGVGDWDGQGQGGLHSAHSSNKWYIRVNSRTNSGSENNVDGYCRANNHDSCNIRLWVR